MLVRGKFKYHSCNGIISTKQDLLQGLGSCSAYQVYPVLAYFAGSKSRYIMYWHICNVSLPRGRFPCQEKGFLAKSKVSLPRAKFLCQEQSFFAKGQRNLGGVPISE